MPAALAENRQLAQENLRIQELERKHLARELHDELGQYLNAIKLDAVSIRENGAADAASNQRLGAIIRTVDHVHACRQRHDRPSEARCDSMNWVCGGPRALRRSLAPARAEHAIRIEPCTGTSRT